MTTIAYRDLLLTGPGTLAGRYLRQYWQPVYRSADLAPGQVRPIRIMSENFALYRSASGVARVVGERCAHRGVKMASGSVEGERLRCAYHGWLYDADGRCVQQPAEPRPFLDRARIATYPTREYLGLVFAFLGTGEPPELPRIPEYEDNGFIQSVVVSAWPHNYFTQLENTLDYAHTAFLHWQFKNQIPEQYVAEETEYGMRTFTPGLRGAALQEIGHLHMPNAQEFVTVPVSGETVGFFTRGWRVPVDDASFLRFDIRVVPLKGKAAEEFRAREAVRAANRIKRPIPEVAQEYLDGRRSLDDLKADTTMNFADMTRLQDAVVLMGLEPMATREHEEQLGQSDRGITLARRLWKRELAAFAAGEPLTQWRRPDYLFADIEALTA
jgi:5,5'-dehydrodivanillate O-demethylase oxygenase subunit